MSIYTTRLHLRSWQNKDIENLYKMHQDPRLLEFLPNPPDKKTIEDFIDCANRHLKTHGYTFWAVELLNNQALIGFIGLKFVAEKVPFAPATEISCRLQPEYWGKGYATEGARAALTFGFNECKLQEIVSATVPANLRGRRVMEKIGLEQDLKGDFHHPDLPKEHHLSQHVLYRKSKK